MKKLLSIFSLGVLLFSSLAPSFTYAVDINEVSSLLESFLQSTDNEQQENNENIFQQSSNPELQNIEDEAGEDEIEIIGGNNHIIWNKTKGTITIYSENYSYGITLQDKDLGANGIGETGLYYQWGNNYGKTEGLELLDTLIERGDYDGKGYDGVITGFINRFNANSDYWEIEDSNNPLESLHNNLWGGGNDDETNNFGYDESTHKATNVSERRGPCPEGYHVPSLGERSKLLYIYFNGINKPEYLTEDSTYTGIYFTTSEEGTQHFIDTFKIYFGGQIYVYNSPYVSKTQISNKQYSYLRTSTPKPINGQYNNQVFNAGISNDFVYTNRSYTRSVGLQVRCFKNEYIPYSKKVIFNPNGGAFSGMEINQTKEYTYAANENGIIPIYNIQIPDRISNDMSQQSGWMFAGRYTESGVNDEWGDEWLGYVTDDTENQTVYAKWLPFNDMELNDIGLNGIYIMDRNLGAEEVAKGTYGPAESSSKLGYYYQWGNNYGFKSEPNTYILNSGFDLVSNPDHDINPWGPTNNYYNSKFIKRSYPGRWDNEDNINLRGGENPTNPDNDKQGPCPEGYHVPDINEWKAVYDAFTSKRTSETTYCSNFGSNYQSCFASKLKLSFAGGRDSYSTYINGQGTYASYWSSSPSFNSNYAYYLYFTNNYDTPQNSNNRANGYSVRCFKNSSTKTLTLYIENGKEDKEYGLRWREQVGTFIKNVKYYGYKIIGWFYDTEYLNRVNETDNIKENKYIYAKLERNPWYTYDSNKGLFDNQSNKKIIKSANIGTGITIKQETQFKEYKNTIAFTGASSLYLILDWSRSNSDKINIYTGHYGENQEPLYHINQQCGPKGCNRHLEYEIPYDVITIVTYGSVNGNNVSAGASYTATITANGLNSYEIEDIKEIPSNLGYTFSGWYEGTTGENNKLIIADKEFDFNHTPVTRDRTFYAKWSPHNYTIQFNTNEGTGLAEDINAIYGEEIQLPKVTKKGYTFKGWKSEDGTIYINTIPEGTGVTTEDGVTVTLTAQWELIPVITPSAGGGQSITPTKQETKVREQEHNSADTEEQKTKNTQTKNPTSNTVATEEIKQQVKKVEDKSLTRGEVAIMTNILLEVYPQLVEGKQELDDVTNACSNYADEQNFTKDEKKAITRLCKLSIMGIHNETSEPLEEFLVNSKSTNDEFSKVINRSIETYNEKDLSTIKDALKKLEGDEENVVFGTVYEVFMSIKNIFN